MRLRIGRAVARSGQGLMPSPGRGGLLNYCSDVKSEHPYITFPVIVAIVAVFTFSACGFSNQPQEPAGQPQKPAEADNTPAPSLPSLQPESSLTPTSMSKERVTFQTSDQVAIVGDFTSLESATKAVLLLHMMPANRQSYAKLAEASNKAGFATLAIDFRGHGESTDQAGKKLDYRNFSDAEQQRKRLDVDAAMNFLKEKGFAESAISFVGASIGANLSLDAMQRYSTAPKGVILSPGLDYRGVKTEPAVKGLQAGQNVWIIAAKGDSYSAESAEALQKLKPEISKTTIYDGSDHGTALFQSQPALIADIVKFLSE